MGDMEQDFKERTKEQYEAIDDFKEHWEGDPVEKFGAVGTLLTDTGNAWDGVGEGLSETFENVTRKVVGGGVGGELFEAHNAVVGEALEGVFEAAGRIGAAGARIAGKEIKAVGEVPGHVVAAIEDVAAHGEVGGAAQHLYEAAGGLVKAQVDVLGETAKGAAGALGELVEGSYAQMAEAAEGVVEIAAEVLGIDDVEGPA
jgi:hypothetical protein